MNRRLASAAIAVLIMSALVASCAPATAVPPTAVPPTAVPTQAPQAEAPKTYRVGFSVIVEHPSLAENEQGVIDGLAQEGFVVGENLIWDSQNAQGEVANAQAIAEKFLADGVDLMVGCTTPCAQALVQETKGLDVPVVFIAITDPVGAGLVESVDEPSGTNVTGTFAPSPIEELFELYAQIKPDMKKIGTIYNSSESNSVVQAEWSRDVAAAKGYEWVEVTVASSADVKTATESLVGKVDTVVLIQDNTVASALDAVIKVCEDNGIPVFSMDTASVEAGVIATLASDGYSEGVATGILAARILNGEDAGTITPVKPTVYRTYFNLAAAERVGITVPEELVKQAYEVYE